MRRDAATVVSDSSQTKESFVVSRERAVQSCDAKIVGTGIRTPLVFQLEFSAVGLDSSVFLRCASH